MKPLVKPKASKLAMSLMSDNALVAPAPVKIPASFVAIANVLRKLGMPFEYKPSTQTFETVYQRYAHGPGENSMAYLDIHLFNEEGVCKLGVVSFFPYEVTEKGRKYADEFLSLIKSVFAKVRDGVLADRAKPGYQAEADHVPRHGEYLNIEDGRLNFGIVTSAISDVPVTEQRVHEVLLSNLMALEIVWGDFSFLGDRPLAGAILAKDATPLSRQIARRLAKTRSASGAGDSDPGSPKTIH